MGYNLYTDVDSLYDTRFEIIRLINPYEANKIIMDGSYHNRKVERYGNIPYEMFYPVWRLRGKKVFTAANNTYIPMLIYQYYTALYVDELYSEVRDDLILFVNVYPYDLSIVERELLEAIIGRMIPKCKIQTISVPDSELTMEWIVANVGVMFKYNYIEWMAYQLTNGVYNVGMKKIRAVIPNVVAGNIPDKALTEEEIGDVDERFKTVCMLESISPSYYSVIVKRDMREEKK